MKLARRVIAALLVAATGVACSGASDAQESANASWRKGVKVVDLRGKAKGGEYPEVRVGITDNDFSPRIVRVDPGVTVSWTNRGRSRHNVVKAVSGQDFGRRFGSGNLAAGTSYEFRFTKPGVYRYYCSFHGTATKGMVGMVVVGSVDIDSGKPIAVAGGPSKSGTIRVPQQFRTIQAAVDAAKPGSLVLIDDGIYHEAVHIDPGHENIVLRGVDRNTVILDGAFDAKLPNGVLVQADGVAIENMTAMNYTTNGFYWRGIRGYRGSYLTTYRTGDYGLYAFDSEIGQFDHDFAVGSRDASYYIGQCTKCRAVISDSVGEWSGLGYSGTNAGGELYIINSTFRFNRAGIVPNSETGEKLWPQRNLVIVGNRVYSNNNIKTSAIDIATTALGNGILIAGGHDNTVERNRVWDHDVYGIGVVPLPEKALEPDNPKARNFEGIGNSIRSNDVSDSRVGDLALVASLDSPNDPMGNCFANNVHGSSSPAGLEALLECGRTPSPDFTSDVAKFVELFTAVKPAELDYKIAPLPPLSPQPNMRRPLRAHARSANSGVPMAVDVAAIKLPGRDG